MEQNKKWYVVSTNHVMQKMVERIKVVLSTERRHMDISEFYVWASNEEVGLGLLFFGLKG